MNTNNANGGNFGDVKTEKYYRIKLRSRKKTSIFALNKTYKKYNYGRRQNQNVR